MNLHRIAAPFVAAVNPFVLASVQRSNGYTTSGDGTQQPQYFTGCMVRVQRQALSYKDLMQVDKLNLNGEACALYMDGDWSGVSRTKGKGGDMVTMPDGLVWLTVHVLENWSATAGWTKVAAVLQVDGVQQ